jgi:hypothetical protein
MEVSNLRRQRDAGTLVALFDLEVTPDVTLLDCQLRDTPKGLRAFPPPGRGGRWTAQIEPGAYSQIGRSAATVFLDMEGTAPNDNFRNVG